ncbi:MAG: methyltransferase domain-containing protein [Actinomycetia bacterium]|nr:methyltransferase domain-containing protein [Actinomycetes bacterium]MCP5031008.1 methyltransferase domain-containing protein [Actinomycetes bacterium]
MAIDYDKISGDYATHRQVHPRLLGALWSDGELTESSRVLEVGCGTGNYIGALNAVIGCKGWGVDPSEAMLEHARRQDVPVQFGTGSSELLPFPDGHFDLVFSVDVIHHIGDRRAYFEQALRVLVDNGRICTATDSPSIIRSRLLAHYFPDTIPADLERYPPIADLEGEMKAAGFSDVTHTTVEAPYLITDAAPFRDRAYSVLHLIDDNAHQDGVDRMVKDLDRSPIHGVARYLLLWAGAR